VRWRGKLDDPDVWSYILTVGVWPAFSVLVGLTVYSRSRRRRLIRVIAASIVTGLVVGFLLTGLVAGVVQAFGVDFTK